MTFDERYAVMVLTPEGEHGAEGELALPRGDEACGDGAGVRIADAVGATAPGPLGGMGGAAGGAWRPCYAGLRECVRPRFRGPGAGPFPAGGKPPAGVGQLR
ncbi:hypothetical protein HOK021_20260 [Streptomyces hygroscopicus]|nr:hypothetical protein HOK021_20260 [Streptomyces hygroscopicus]